MFLEKFNRYVRRYDVVLGARKSSAPVLPLVANDGEYSVFDAINEKLKTGKATIKQSNGDLVELIKAEHLNQENAIVLLFHRASPDAADPTYRKRAGGRLSVRVADKEDDEEQSVSCHLVIRATPHSGNSYFATLEEIPGLSMGVLREVLAALLQDYTYKFEKKKKEQETYCTIRAEGMKSETVADALKTGKANFITLVRKAPAKYVDGDGLWEPMNDIMKLRVKGEIQEENWRDKIGGLLKTAKDDGWEKFNIEIALPEKRTRQVSLDRMQDAQEILFVKADNIVLANEIGVCSTDFHRELVEKSMGVLRLIEGK